jgi:hypothetical protein
VHNAGEREREDVFGLSLEQILHRGRARFATESTPIIVDIYSAAFHSPERRICSSEPLIAVFLHMILCKAVLCCRNTGAHAPIEL